MEGTHTYVRIRVALAGVVVAGLMLITANAASAAPTVETEFDNIVVGNSWWLESSTEITTDVTSSSSTESRDGAFSSYVAQIQQPINPNGSSTWPAKRGVLPVQFKLTASPTTETQTTTTTTTAVTKVPSFKSIYSDGGSNGNEWAALTHVPPVGTTVADIADLSAVFAYTDGESHGGSLRWQINLTNGKAINVYYGETASWTGQSGSGVNLADATDDRVETMALNGVFYNTWEAVKADFGTLKVGSVALTVDSGWQNAPNGDQEIDLSSATVNGSTVVLQDSYAGAPDVDLNNDGQDDPWVPGPSLVTQSVGAWVPGPAGTPVQTNVPPAKLVVKKFNDSNNYEVVNETLSSAQGDNSGNFRQIDGKYMYNLKVESLTGPGDYKVYLDVNGDGILEETPGVFSLK